MQNTLAIQTDTGKFNREELDTLKATIARGTTDAQFSLFVQTCANSGLNPFLNHIYCIVYDSEKNGPQMSIQFSVEGILYLARQKSDFRGTDVEIVCENDEFRYNAKTKEVTHEIGFPRGKILGAYAIARREGFEPCVVIMEWREIEHLYNDNKPKNLWKKFPYDMFKKHVLKRAVKFQFGIDITEEEAPTVGGVDNLPEYKLDHSNVIEHIPEDPKEPEPTEQDMKDGVWKQINQKVTEYGKKKSDVTALIKKHFNKKVDALTLTDLVALNKLCDLEFSQPEQDTDLDKEMQELGIA